MYYISSTTLAAPSSSYVQPYNYCDQRTDPTVLTTTTPQVTFFSAINDTVLTHSEDSCGSRLNITLNFLGTSIITVSSFDKNKKKYYLRNPIQVRRYQLSLIFRSVPKNTELLQYKYHLYCSNMSLQNSKMYKQLELHLVTIYKAISKNLFQRNHSFQLLT
jgi:hypothetical protein